MVDPDVPLLEMPGITKRLGAIAALDRIDPRPFAMEILGVVGENVAGNSTLRNAATKFSTNFRCRARLSLFAQAALKGPGTPQAPFPRTSAQARHPFR